MKTIKQYPLVNLGHQISAFYARLSLVYRLARSFFFYAFSSIVCLGSFFIPSIRNALVYFSLISSSHTANAVLLLILADHLQSKDLEGHQGAVSLTRVEIQKFLIKMQQTPCHESR